MECRVLGEFQDVLHIIQAGRFGGGPFGGAESSFGKSIPAGGFVSEFQAFPDIGENDGVVADDVAAPDGMHADFGF